MLEPILGPTVQSILAELEELYPPTNPHHTEELAAIMYKAGQRSVVEWMKTRIKEDS
tara:strand:+ start:350 stop:520 length:171 start_codon:yes stop_codon:yes gene_type:complete